MNDLELKKVFWRDTLSVGVPEIDEQHKKFLSIANDGIDAIIAGNSQATADTIRELISYANFHFKYESELMAKYKFPESSYHYDAHADFYDKIEDLKKSESASKEYELISFMQNWLVLHIGSTDKKLGKFISNK